MSGPGALSPALPFGQHHQPLFGTLFRHAHDIPVGRAGLFQDDDLPADAFARQPCRQHTRTEYFRMQRVAQAGMGPDIDAAVSQAPDMFPDACPRQLQLRGQRVAGERRVAQTQAGQDMFASPAHARFDTRMERSSAGAEWVMAPMAMRSTPARA